jgi:hypothetical protein
MQAFYRTLAEKQIRVPGIISVSRWLFLIYKLSEKDLHVEKEAIIRLGRKDDLDSLASSQDMDDPANSLLKQDIRFWQEYGFRCLYVGFFKDDPQPCFLMYVIDDSDNHRFKKMKYWGGLYQPLTPDAVYNEGIWIRKDVRQNKLSYKFYMTIYKLLCQRGKKFIWGHTRSIEARTSLLKMTSRAGWVPDHWISKVTINLSFFRSNVFIHHRIKDSDRDQFPLTLFGRGSIQ